MWEDGCFLYTCFDCGFVLHVFFGGGCPQRKCQHLQFAFLKKYFFQQSSTNDQGFLKHLKAERVYSHQSDG